MKFIWFIAHRPETQIKIRLASSVSDALVPTSRIYFHKHRMPTEIKMHKPHKPLLINIDFKFYLKKQPAKKTEDESH